MGFKKRLERSGAHFAETAWNRIARSDGSNNLRVAAAESATMSEVEPLLRRNAKVLGLYLSHTTTLGRTRYPGNRHWHFKRSAKMPGCLDVTYWPGGALMWITMRYSEPAWVHEAGAELKTLLERGLTHSQ